MQKHRPYEPPATSPLIHLYTDEFLIVVEKPAGLLSVPGRSTDKQDCLMSRIKVEYPEALNVHRLDMDTSGIMLIARNPDMQRHLSHLFQIKNINKQYIAVVSGIIKHESGIIDLPLNSDWPNRPKQIIDYKNGKPAQTFYQVIDYDTKNKTTRVRLFPKTGRTHQLRVHMLALNHPVLGDRLYASQQIVAQANRLLLHASRLSFTHPISGQLITISSKPSF